MRTLSPPFATLATNDIRRLMLIQAAAHVLANAVQHDPEAIVSFAEGLWRANEKAGVWTVDSREEL